MAELKNTFTAGKMNKDLDERIIPSTEYREALNIGVPPLRVAMLAPLKIYLVTLSYLVLFKGQTKSI